MRHELNVIDFDSNVGYVRSGSTKCSVLSEFKSAMPRSELNSLSTRPGAIRLREEFSSVRVQVGNATHPSLWPGSWLNHFVWLSNQSSWSSCFYVDMCLNMAFDQSFSSWPPVFQQW